MATSSDRWQGRVTSISANRLASVTNKYTLLRDPRQGLISAQKSKVTYDADIYGNDVKDRNAFVPELRRLAGQGYKECMDFEEYVRTLQVVHDEDKAHQLNAHFLPQQFGCFRDLAPQNGGIAAPITNRDFVRALDRSLGNRRVYRMYIHRVTTLPSLKPRMPS